MLIIIIFLIPDIQQWTPTVYYIHTTGKIMQYTILHKQIKDF
jgi:hypothetical protein